MDKLDDNRLRIALAALRLGVFIVMIMWTLDKLIAPDHAAGIFARFYGITGLGTAIMYAIGTAELLIVIGFVLGIARRITYGLVLLFHSISTLSSFPMYLGFDNLLFFAAWPMLAACFALYLLRDEDTLLTVKVRKNL
jgi:putative oxidoreductase